MKRFFSGVFITIGVLSLLPLIYLSIAHTVTSEFILSAIAVGVICWIISLFLSRHYYDLVANIGTAIVCFLLLINLIYSRVIVAPGGETNFTMICLYIYWGILIIVEFCGSIKQYCWDEAGYKLDQRIKALEVKKLLERDD